MDFGIIFILFSLLICGVLIWGIGYNRKVNGNGSMQVEATIIGARPTYTMGGKVYYSYVEYEVNGIVYKTITDINKSKNPNDIIIGKKVMIDVNIHNPSVLYEEFSLTKLMANPRGEVGLMIILFMIIGVVISIVNFLKEFFAML